MRKISLVLLFLFQFLSLSAQTGTVKGTVYYKNPNGTTEVLPFAQVYNLEAEKLVECDENGQFSTTVKGEATLIATYVGYSLDTLKVTPASRDIKFYLTGSNEVQESYVTARQAALSRLSAIRTEAITTAGICKMACCNLSESFENSASVATNYTDAVIGAKQIKLLGLSGIYTQMLDENRPAMRGLSSPFAMTYVPGQWLESIQIAKGPSSVINGVEAITGLINLEHRKPTDEIPLYFQAYGSSDAMIESNVASSLQLNDKWSTVLLGHFGKKVASFDHNHDGFRDEPLTTQYNIGSRWLYYDPNGTQVRFGVSYVSDNRLGGQMNYSKQMAEQKSYEHWGSLIKNQMVNAYFKFGYPLREDQSESLAVIADYTHYNTNSFFGIKDYDGYQNSGYFNFLYQNQNENHSIEVGASVQYDAYREFYNIHPFMGLTVGSDNIRTEGLFGAFAEYTYSKDEKVTAVLGVRGDYNTLYSKFLFTPRMSFKYSFTDDIIFRLSAGRGYHSPHLVTDNLGIMSTGRYLEPSVFSKRFDLEEAWTFGGNITWYLPFGYENNSYVSLEYFRNQFVNQLIVDQDYNYGNPFISVYNLQDLDMPNSYTNTYQFDFSSDITENFNIVATFRYTDAKVTLKGQGLVERPMTSRYKAVFNAQYKTHLSKWIFDFTAQLNGPMKLYDFAGGGYSPAYPLLFAQITHKMKGVDIYVGGENLTNFRQHDAIINADDPFSLKFNATSVWGPLMGIKVYAGIRVTIWK
ncbi:MAG: TonB-dependent receptor [Bacteroidales bacterium]|nr:TonB-dependent receptor [Bacteroidales bacterium]